MFEYYFAGAGLRFFEVIVYAALWIVIGFFVASFFRRILGEERTRSFFGNGTKRGLLTGWIMGMLIPVCSLGVIPIVREMHRAKVQGGTIIAFGLTAPLFNPLSVLYGLSLSDPIAIITFSFCSLLIVTGLGFLWDKFIPVELEKAKEKDPEQTPAYGIKRMIAMLDSCSQEIAGPASIYILIGMLGSAAAAAFLPYGYLQMGLEQTDTFAPIKVTVVATPIYTTPLLAMSQIGGMFQHGNSIGGAFALLILGAGVNLGLILCFANLMGFRRILLFLAILIGVTLGLGYAISGPLYPKGIEPKGHSHAFDVYSNPFPAVQNDPWGIAQRKATDFWKRNEFGGTYLYAALLLVGIVFRIVSSRFDLETWYVTQDSETTKYDTLIPDWVLAMTMLLLLVGTSIASCYLYYPSPKEILADLDIINTECVLDSRNEKWEAAEKWIQICDDSSRRLEIGIYLRRGKVEEFHSTTAKLYRETLDELKHAVEDKDSGRAKEQSHALQKAYTRMIQAFKSKYVDAPSDG